MGSCVSLSRDSDSAMKLRLSVNGGTEDSEAARKSYSAPVGSSSKEESFFDSQPWLESDSEDDFCSVNGDDAVLLFFCDTCSIYSMEMPSIIVQSIAEYIYSVSQNLIAYIIYDLLFVDMEADFTPSSGSTPVHHSFSLQVNKASASVHVEETCNVTSPTDKKSTLSQLFNESLRCDDNTTERTPDHGVVLRKEGKSTQCCLPKLISSRSFTERKRRMSPANNVG